MTRALPVAQDGIEAKIGEKNTEMKNMNPVVIAVRPVLPPSFALVEIFTSQELERRTTDTSCTLNKGCNRTSTHEGAHTNTEGIDAVGDGGIFKVKCHRITKASKFSHRV